MYCRFYGVSSVMWRAVHESFKDYVTEETLEGDNKYDAGEYGMQVWHCTVQPVGHRYWHCRHH